MLPDSLFLLAKGGRVILSRNRDVSGGHAIGTQCDLWAIASKFGRHNSRRRAPTRGASTNCQSFSDKKPASSRERPLEFATAHYDLHSSRCFALGRAPTRGAPTDCLLSAFGPEKGAHKGRPYRLSSVGVWPWEGHPQGVPFLPIVFSRRFALRRAPTRGAPTRFRQSHEVFSNLMRLP